MSADTQAVMLFVFLDKQRISVSMPTVTVEVICVVKKCRSAHILMSQLRSNLKKREESHKIGFLILDDSSFFPVVRHFQICAIKFKETRYAHYQGYIFIL